MGQEGSKDGENMENEAGTSSGARTQIQNEQQDTTYSPQLNQTLMSGDPNSGAVSGFQGGTAQIHSAIPMTTEQRETVAAKLNEPQPGVLSGFQGESSGNGQVLDPSSSEGKLGDSHLGQGASAVVGEISHSDRLDSSTENKETLGAVGGAASGRESRMCGTVPALPMDEHESAPSSVTTQCTGTASSASGSDITAAAGQSGVCDIDLGAEPGKLRDPENQHESTTGSGTAQNTQIGGFTSVSGVAASEGESEVCGIGQDSEPRESQESESRHDSNPGSVTAGKTGAAGLASGVSAPAGESVMPALDTENIEIKNSENRFESSPGCDSAENTRDSDLDSGFGVGTTESWKSGYPPDLPCGVTQLDAADDRIPVQKSECMGDNGLSDNSAPLASAIVEERITIAISDNSGTSLSTPEHEEGKKDSRTDDIREQEEFEKTKAKCERELSSGSQTGNSENGNWIPEITRPVASETDARDFPALPDQVLAAVNIHTAAHPESEKLQPENAVGRKTYESIEYSTQFWTEMAPESETEAEVRLSQSA